jgi:hypothetical protein
MYVEAIARQHADLHWWERRRLRGTLEGAQGILRSLEEAFSSGNILEFDDLLTLFIERHTGTGGGSWFSIVELDDGPMVTPATPGASAPTVLGGNISTVGSSDLIHATLATNLPWSGEHAFPIQSPSWKDYIETFPWQGTALGAAAIYFLGRASAPILLTPKTAVFPITTCPHCTQPNEVY